MSHAPCFSLQAFLKRGVAVLGNLTGNRVSNLQHLDKKASGNPEIWFVRIVAQALLCTRPEAILIKNIVLMLLWIPALVILLALLINALMVYY